MTNSAVGHEVREPILGLIAASEGQSVSESIGALVRAAVERVRRLFIRLGGEPPPLDTDDEPAPR